jgi:hypothetical protein
MEEIKLIHRPRGDTLLLSTEEITHRLGKHPPMGTRPPERQHRRGSILLKPRSPHTVSPLTVSLVLEQLTNNLSSLPRQAILTNSRPAMDIRRRGNPSKGMARKDTISSGEPRLDELQWNIKESGDKNCIVQIEHTGAV